MTPRLVFAVTPDAEIGGARERREQRDQASCGRRAHLGAVAARELRPAAIAPRPGLRPRDQRLGRREIRQPGVVVIEARVVALLYAARRPPHGAEPRALVLRPRRAEAHDANHRFA